MKIYDCPDYEKMSQLAYDMVMEDIRQNPNLLLCPATGQSPRGMYAKLAEIAQYEADLFKSLQIIKLDEWGGIPASDPNSCETYIRESILDPLQIDTSRYISFESSPVDAKKECDRMENEIMERGPIDVCILGMGKNGHLGFNEPSNFLIPECHVAELSQTSLMHSMTDNMAYKPNYGLTLGMANILQAKKIILLLTGPGKSRALKELLNKEISTFLPASFLWLHPEVHCYIDKSSR
ncbi:MAG TPA: galactosamine-6-phosphate isomerase [Arenibacter sp.]|nr:galactosamine-6-phosphate isomerase [Arenibacter sp.]